MRKGRIENIMKLEGQSGKLTCQQRRMELEGCDAHEEA